MGLLFRALALLPLPALHHIGDWLYVIAFRLWRWRVPQARRNLEAAFPEKTPAEREAILRESYRILARTLMEGIWGFRASGKALAARVHFDNPEVVEAFKAARVSLVLLTGHVCNWEWLLLASGVRFDFPIDAIYKPLRLASVDRYVRDARSRFGGNPIPFDSFLFELMKRAGEPRAYAMVADQTPVKRMAKHWVRFLNQDTAFYVGSERIARFLDAPILYVEMTRLRAGHYAARFHVLATPPYDEATDWAPVVAERYARHLEATIRAHPADWLWIHNKWRYARPTSERN